MMSAKRVVLTCMVVVAFPAGAFAATVGGEGTDPAGDGLGGPGTDLVSASWSFDDQAGQLSVTTATAAAPTDTDWGAVNVTARPKRDCSGDPWATMRTSNTGGGASAGAGNAADGQQPDGSTGTSYTTAQVSRSESGRLTTMWFSHARLVGRSAGCVTVHISRRAVLDTIAMPAGSEGVATPTPSPGSTPAPSPYAQRHDVRLGSTRPITFRRGRARVPLVGLASGMSVRLAFRRPGRPTVTVATGRLRSRRAQPQLVTVRLTKAGLRRLRRGRHLQARLTLSWTAGTHKGTRHYSIQLRRR